MLPVVVVGAEPSLVCLEVSVCEGRRWEQLTLGGMMWRWRWQGRNESNDGRTRWSGGGKKEPIGNKEFQTRMGIQHNHVVSEF